MPRKPVFTERRVLSKAEAAGYIGRSTSWFDEHAEELYAEGFPRPLPGILGGYDRVAIDRWFDGRGGAVAQDYDSAWKKASSGG